ncbi:MAG: PIN domain-containing protein [Dehalococcoidia bacterium]
MSRLLDTNILIDALNGVESALALLLEPQDSAISLVTWMEVLVGARREEDEAAARLLLDTMRVIPITSIIAESAWRIRRDSRLKLIDAIILATARVDGRTLWTRNTKDFREDDPTVHVPYSL